MGSIAQSNFLQALGWAVLNSLWQMAFLWVAYQLVAAVIVKRPATRNLLSTIFLFAGFTWFVYTFVGLLKDTVDAPFTGFAVLMANDSVNEWLFTALPFASLLYLACLIIPVLRFIRNYRYVRVIRAQGLSRPSAALRLFVKNVSAQMNVRKTVEVWISEFVASPVTIGYLKPVVLLPVAALSQLSTRQVEAILLHEIAHIRRYDYLLNLGVRFIQAILYFNPFVRAFASIIEREREKSCDETVLQFQYEPHGYASALLTLEQQAQSMQLLLIPAFSGRKSDLLLRIEMIIGMQAGKKRSDARTSGIIGGLLACIFFFGLMLMSQPGQFRAMSHRPMAFFSRYLPYQAAEKDSPGNLQREDMVRNEHGIRINEQPLMITNSERPQAGSSRNMGLATVTGNISADITANSVISNRSIADLTEIATEDAKILADPLNHINDPRLIQAAIRTAASVPPPPSLNKSQQKQVKEAMEVSKRVLEELKWKNMEVTIADAMTLAQKEMAKQEFMQQTSQANWKKMEENLKIAYNKIDWFEIKKNLNTAMVQIRLDSVQHVYDLALSGLDALQKELDAAGLKALPDTDVTLDAVQQKQQEVKTAVRTLRAVRTKKIIQL